ncbi:MAG: hypothetical protein ABI400_11930 [Lacisediminihabitans sp.]
MSDDITVSGGGSVEVATATLLSQRQHLRQLSAELNRCLTKLRAIDAQVTRARLQAVSAPLSAMRAETAMADAQNTLRSARDRAASLSDRLNQAALMYGEAENVADALARQLSSIFAYQLGTWLPLLTISALPFVLPGALTSVGIVAGVWAFTPEDTRKKSTEQWINDNKVLLSDPRFVSLVRLAVSSSDDFGEGLVHFPEPLGEMLGDSGLGILGVGSSAAVVVGVAGVAGLLKETPVTVSSSKPKDGKPPPSGLAERAARIPTGSSQIRIDKYSQLGGEPYRYEVYLGGTRDFSLTAGTEPWDMTSNLTGVAGGSEGSLEATRQAMKAAGIRSTTPVTFTGYSQGGLVAAQLAASGDYDTRGLVTFGGPAGGVSVPHDIPYVALEHADDLVPATGGVWKSSDPVLVTRTVYGDHPYTGEAIVPAHELSNYRATARMADASDEQRLASLRNVLSDFAAGTTNVETSYFHAVRTTP